VYDSVADKALDTTQDAVNQIKVINHSNADVYATLEYAAEKTDDKDYSDTTGDFAKDAEDTDTQLTEKEGDVPEYLTLSTADNSGDASVAGTPPWRERRQRVRSSLCRRALRRNTKKRTELPNGRRLERLRSELRLSSRLHNN